MIDCTGPRLRLAATVQVDLRVVRGQARRISEAPDRSDGLDDHDGLIPTLSRSLLPDWSDEWLLLERER
jgi:hypothetical protein